MGRGLEAGTSRSGRTLYGQVAEHLEALVLAGPLGEETVLPPEWALAEQLAISRGTLRRALADLEERGLLRREGGRGTFVNPAARLRQVVWRQLAQVARPDSRFGYDFASFIPDFDGSDRCAGSIGGLADYVSARTIVVTPDNNLESFRGRALADGKRLLVCTYALARGFVLLDGSVVAASDRPLAATLDGMERFGHSLGYQDLCAVGRVDLVVTGAAAVTREEVHFGKGHGYFDIEWGWPDDTGGRPGLTAAVCMRGRTKRRAQGRIPAPRTRHGGRSGKRSGARCGPSPVRRPAVEPHRRIGFQLLHGPGGRGRALLPARPDVGPGANRRAGHGHGRSSVVSSAEPAQKDAHAAHCRVAHSHRRHARA
jgi:DNA-binding transcriptional regulator YhcF (GntR family)/5-formyltetrahydrofolate cyclo-ligase